MKVKELIEQLENYDPDFEVKIAEVTVEKGEFYDEYFTQNLIDIDYIVKSTEDDIIYIAMEK